MAPETRAAKGVGRKWLSRSLAQLEEKVTKGVHFSKEKRRSLEPRPASTALTTWLPSPVTPHPQPLPLQGQDEARLSSQDGPGKMLESADLILSSLTGPTATETQVSSLWRSSQCDVLSTHSRRGRNWPGTCCQ